MLKWPINRPGLKFCQPLLQASKERPHAFGVENVQTERPENGEAGEDEKRILSYKERLTSLFQPRPCLLLPMYCNNDRVSSIANYTRYDICQGLNMNRIAKS